MINFYSISLLGRSLKIYNTPAIKKPLPIPKFFLPFLIWVYYKKEKLPCKYTFSKGKVLKGN